MKVCRSFSGILRVWSVWWRGVLFVNGKSDQRYDIYERELQLWKRGSWGQHGAHLGPTGPRWAPCWPHEFCYLGPYLSNTVATTHAIYQAICGDFTRMPEMLGGRRSMCGTITATSWFIIIILTIMNMLQSVALVNITATTKAIT